MLRDIGVLSAVLIIALIVGVWAYVLWPESQPAPVTERPKVGSPLPPDDPEILIQFTVLASGDHSGVRERKNYLYSDEAEFAKVWDAAHPGEPMPDVDFSYEAVIALFAGERSSGGHSIKVEEVIVADGAETVFIARIEPGPGCIVTQAITTPFTFVKIPMPTRALKSEERVETVECP